MQRRVRDLLNAKNIDFEELDGADQNFLEERNALFALSKQRGKYPQVFIVDEDGKKTFVGLWEQMEVSLKGRSRLLPVNHSLCVMLTTRSWVGACLLAWQSLNECCNIPASILEENPQIETFDKVFKDCKRK